MDRKQQNIRPNILVVCGRNKRRSRTAEHLFKNDQRISVKSAGISAQSPVQVSERLVGWADLILVMDNTQRNRMQSMFREHGLPKIMNLDIEDIYEYQDPVLVDMLVSKINQALAEVFEI